MNNIEEHKKICREELRNIFLKVPKPWEIITTASIAIGSMGGLIAGYYTIEAATRERLSAVEQQQASGTKERDELKIAIKEVRESLGANSEVVKRIDGKLDVILQRTR